jgi:hypothetical protein
MQSNSASNYVRFEYVVRFVVGSFLNAYKNCWTFPYISKRNILYNCNHKTYYSVSRNILYLTKREFLKYKYFSSYLYDNVNITY